MWSRAVAEGFSFSAGCGDELTQRVDPGTGICAILARFLGRRNLFSIV
jgi:hypothetical protein